MPNFPHLTETESVRQEAASQYGVLNDAAAFQQAHRASLSPDVEAAALRQRNAAATAEVQDDLSIAQDRIDEEYGDDTYRVLDAAVRGEALRVVAEDAYGRPQHLVVGWTDRWRSIVPENADARANAQAEAAKGRLGAEARAEVTRMVEEATNKILARVAEKLGSKHEEVEQIRQEEIAKITEDDSGDGEDDPVTEGSPSTTEGNDTSETEAGATTGSETSTDDGSTTVESGEWPRRVDELDKIAKANKVEFTSTDKKNIAGRIAALEKAGVTPPTKE